MASKNIVRLLQNQSKLRCKSLPSRFTESFRYSSSWEVKDKETHTGQTYEPDDYRLSRFVDKKKEVNENWAIKLINEVPPKSTKERIVSCDGGGGPLGHPKVYINLDKPGNHTCGYCGLRFHQEEHH